MNANLFTIWAQDAEEANRISNRLDETAEQYGAGQNAFRISIIPGALYPADTVYLSNAAAEELRQTEIVSEGWRGDL